MKSDYQGFELQGDDRLVVVAIFQRVRIISTHGPEHIKDAYPGWEIIEHKLDGEEPSYLLERWF